MEKKNDYKRETKKREIFFLQSFEEENESKKCPKTWKFSSQPRNAKNTSFRFKLSSLFAERSKIGRSAIRRRSNSELDSMSGKIFMDFDLSFPQDGRFSFVYNPIVDFRGDCRGKNNDHDFFLMLFDLLFVYSGKVVIGRFTWYRILCSELKVVLVVAVDISLFTRKSTAKNKSPLNFVFQMMSKSSLVVKSYKLLAWKLCILPLRSKSW